MRVASIDIETNGLLHHLIDFTKGLPFQLKPSAKLWCISISTFNTNDIKEITTKNIVHESTQKTRQWLINALATCDAILAHN
jgi:hypothetical protein